MKMTFHCGQAMLEYHDDCVERSKTDFPDAVARCKAKASAVFEMCQLIEKWREMNRLEVIEIIEVLDHFRSKLLPDNIKPPKPELK